MGRIRPGSAPILGACLTLTFLQQRTIRHHLRRSRPETMLNVFYSSEYTSGFPGPAASHLAAPPSLRHKSNVRQTPSLRSSETGETCGKGATWIGWVLTSLGPSRPPFHDFIRIGWRLPRHLVQCASAQPNPDY